MGHTPVARLSFDPAFAGPADWASMYRAHGLQVVPAHMPMPKPAQWKRPAIKEWKQFQEELVPEPRFKQWYSQGGLFVRHQNMGILTGRASRNVFVLDLDTYKGSGAAEWWRAQCFLNNHDEIPHSWRSRTGGGGQHLFFRAPEGWLIPNNATPLGVDVKGQGGFVVVPPSLHTDGIYTWEPGYSPDEVGELEEAPQWLLDAIDAVAESYGGHKPEVRGEDGAPVIITTETPSADHNAFGKRTDGREKEMTSVVYHGLAELGRAGGRPGTSAEEEALLSAFNRYLLSTSTRLPNIDNAAGLELEGRGISLFRAKWDRLARNKWGTPEFQAAIARPNPKQSLVEAFEVPALPAPSAGKLILTGSEFVAGFTPPDYLITGIIQRGYLYSMTARTGHGKTVVTLYLAQAIARGLAVHGRKVKQGSVLYFAGENPDDIRAKYLILADNQHFRIADTPVHFIAGTLDIAQAMADIQAGTEALRPTLVVVDTGPAYFKGDDANSNAQQGAFARLLRHLTTLPGLPAVIVNTHPNKDAREDQLTPGGGGAFLNEVDGNLTLWNSTGEMATMHWLGKFRGPEFEPINWAIRSATSVTVVDSEGVLIPNAVAEPVSETQVHSGENEQQRQENVLLAVIGMNKGASIADFARKANFLTAEGNPQKSKTHRLCRRLDEAGFIKNVLGKYRITPAGKNELGWKDEK
jgi:Bifunctional DNA primase/polymerase, N-terminal/AAA domain